MSSESNINHWVPQGSCLGPLLFLVYINDLPICLEKCTSKLYAEDTDISASNKSIKEAEKQVNNDLNNIHNWLIANKLSLNVLKTKYMIFSTAHKVKNCPKIDVKIHYLSISRCDKKDYLGLILDEELKWNKHIDYMCKKLSSAIFSIKLTRFLPEKALKTLYTSLVESRMRYCCTVWGNCGTTLKTRLQNLQHRAVRVISKKLQL